MAALSLSDKERQAISSILDEAEQEYLSPVQPYLTIRQIDKHIKAVWPDWDPAQICPPPRLKVTTPKGTVASPSDSESRSPEELLGEVGSLKDEVHSLIARISGSVENPRLSPKVEKILANVKKSPPERKAHHDEPDVEVKKQVKAPRKLALETIRKHCADLEVENRNLRHRLRDLRQNYEESQKQIVELRNALKRSEELNEKRARRVANEKNVPRKKARPWH
jgi:hypothetical protein